MPERTDTASIPETALRRFPAMSDRKDEVHLAALYTAWCRQVSFDNALRCLALARGADEVHPGLEPAEFWQDWDRLGCGGTCISTTSALGDLLRAHGYRAEHVLAHIDDAPEPDHVTTLVTVAGRRFLLDTVGLLERPVPLDDEPHDVGTGALAATSRPSDEGWTVEWRTPTKQVPQRCRVLAGTTLGSARSFAVRTQATPTFRSFNRQLYARRNTATGILVVLGPFAVETSPAGEVTPLARHGATVLRTDLGWSDSLVDALDDAGVLG